MSNVAIINSHGHHVIGVYSWTEGFKPLSPPVRKDTEDDVLARALWLERRGFSDEAEEYLEHCVNSG